MNKLDKTFFAFFVESCLFMATGMVAVGILIFSFWKLGLLGASQGDLVIFGFQFACAGGIYMAAVPIGRYMADLSVKTYHFPVLFLGLFTTIYTSMQLDIYIPPEMLRELIKQTTYMLGIPPVAVILMIILKISNGGQLSASHQPHQH